MEGLFNVKWKIEPCFVGDECWCRIIVPVEGEEGDYIIGSGQINEETAQYIVDRHNDYIDQNYNGQTNG